MIRIIWNDRENYFCEQFDIAVKCVVSAFIAFFLGMFVGSQMSFEQGYKAATQHIQKSRGQSNPDQSTTKP